jgi:hypothetical protein
MTTTPSNTARPVTKAHLDRTRAELVRTSAGRDRFAALAVELAATRGWVIDPMYRDTWTRWDEDYKAAKLAYDLARGAVAGS